jgi:hypothetical protein
MFLMVKSATAEQKFFVSFFQKRKPCLASASAALAACLTLSSAHAATAPVLLTGSYVFTASGDLCKTSASAFIANLDNRAVLYYAGPGKTGSALTTGYTQGFDAKSTSVLYTITLPQAPLVGLSSWTGAYAGNSMTNSSANGVVATPKLGKLAGTVTLNLTALSPTSFYGTLAIAPSTGDGCTLLVTSAQ